MTDEAVYVGVKKMEGKSWWQVTLRIGTHKYEWDLYALGARWRIATLNEQNRQLRRQVDALREMVDEYEEKGWERGAGGR
jgi:hypothetical protein